MQNAYLLTGGNTGDRYQFLASALKALETECGEILAVSALFETQAWGLNDQPPFLNQAVQLQTTLSAQVLLERILAIEILLGRVRDQKYGPRTIDIDIIFYGQEVIQEPGLVIPHPHLPNRRFALECLNDIAPSFIHPVIRKSVHTLLEECTDSLTVHKLV
ncbi:MAG TPA: 2-amino-4-hydroxy-6-hydroxymethyldihydropteridine diphosphokinase [Flavisolibacter sp.]|nr:2-amino-4-hydroxy-6-hydroxymethyldihydropteridine diphosphokinase [Flavisolibacter sp.]